MLFSPETNVSCIGQIAAEPAEAPHHISCTAVVVLQVHLVAPTAQTLMVAVGGRYDALLRNLWPAAALTVQPPPGAVGVTINLEKIIKIIQQHRTTGAAAGGLGFSSSSIGSGLGFAAHHQPQLGGLAVGQQQQQLHQLQHQQQQMWQQGGWQGALGGGFGADADSASWLRPGQADVLVCVKGGDAQGADGLLELRMDLVSQLWAAGIAAELLPRVKPSLSEQYAYAQERGVRWLVILDSKSTLGPAQTLRVKSFERRGEDATIPVGEVARYLQMALSGAQDLGGSYVSSANSAGIGVGGGVNVAVGGGGGGVGSGGGLGGMGGGVSVGGGPQSSVDSWEGEGATGGNREALGSYRERDRKNRRRGHQR